MKKISKLLILLALAALLLTSCGKKNPYEGIPNPIATITMQDGSVMRFELFLTGAPNTVANFVELAENGFYNGLSFYRVVPGVLIQSGDPKGDGTGNAGYAIQGEFSENGIENPVSHTRGTISMCRYSDDYDSASSQFFIMHGSHPSYDGHYAAFGRAIDENTLVTIDSIASVPTDSNDRPVGALPTIKSIQIETHDFNYEASKMDFPEEADEEAAD